MSRLTFLIIYANVCRMRPMSIDDPAYPFLAMSGVPSVSFHFISPNVSSQAKQSVGII